MNKSIRPAAIFSILLIFPICALASDLIGKVFDGSAPLAGEPVSLVAACKPNNEEESLIVSENTNNLGVYVFRNVDPGWYGLRIRDSCAPVYMFQRNTEKNIDIGAN